MAKAAPKRKAANGYKLAEPLPKGEILQDISKKKWKLGPSIGQGGFGEIYSAQEENTTGTKYPYVIKIEPHTNGPLFVEMHFYMRNARPADVEEFKKTKGMKTLGIPLYLGSGSHEYKGEKYRFVVMEKFGTDLWKIFLENNRNFPVNTVFKLGVQILDVLEYIHQRGYIHADIKGANILMGVTKETINKQVYLVDFGLTSKFTLEKEFKPNPKKAHDGTIEYLSRDAHKGVQTRRGDLEILAYNLIQWLGCTLPWEKNLKDPNSVHKCKEEYMENVPKMIKACFGNRSPPGAIVDYLNYVNSLNFNSEPDYKKIRKIFLSEIKKAGDSLDSPLKFAAACKTPLKRKSGQKAGASPKRKIGRNKKAEEVSEDEKENMEDDDDLPLDQPSPNSPNQDSDDDDYIIEASFEDETSTNKRGKKIRSKNNQAEEEILLTPSKKRGRPKKIVCKNNSEDEEMIEERIDVKKSVKTNTEKQNGDDPYEGYTDAMKEVMVKKLQNKKTRGHRKRKEAVDDVEQDMEGYTDTMKEIMMKKKERLTNKVGRKKTDLASASKASEDVESSTLKRTRRARLPQSYKEYQSDSD